MVQVVLLNSRSSGGGSSSSRSGFGSRSSCCSGTSITVILNLHTCCIGLYCIVKWSIFDHTAYITMNSKQEQLFLFGLILDTS